MSEQTRPHLLAEAISALVDNNASELELQRILKASEQDASVKATWARYQLVGSVLRGEQLVCAANTSLVSTDFAARVSAAISLEEDSPAVATSTSKAQQGWWYQLGRVALVASVAGGMIIGVQQFNSAAPFDTQMQSNFASNPLPSVPATPAVSLPSGINSPSINTRTVALQNGYESRPQENRRVMFQPRQAAVTGTAISDEAVTRYVNQMIQAHSDNAAMNSNQGVLPYARVIITEEE